MGKYATASQNAGLHTELEENTSHISHCQKVMHLYLDLDLNLKIRISSGIYATYMSNW